MNAVRRPSSRNFTKGFLVVTPGITIRDRLRVLKPNDPDSYYESRELVPRDMLQDLEQARIVITNYHAFKLRETLGGVYENCVDDAVPLHICYRPTRGGEPWIAMGLLLGLVCSAVTAIVMVLSCYIGFELICDD